MISNLLEDRAASNIRWKLKQFEIIRRLDSRLFDKTEFLLSGKVMRDNWWKRQGSTKLTEPSQRINDI